MASLSEFLKRQHAALLPLRFIFGATFLYAGLDKLLDPTFLQTAGRNSIANQMAGWVQVSPVGGLVQAALPYAVPIGLGIALAEVAIGLGALLGLAYRLAALGGLLLSTLFLLTASWAVRPFYLGNDLPYAVGWATLLLSGSGGILALDSAFARRPEPGSVAASAPIPVGDWTQGPPRPQVSLAKAPASPDRRLILRAAVLGAIAISVASVASVTEAALGRLSGQLGGPGSSPTPRPTEIALGSPSAPPSPSVVPSPTSTRSSTPIPTSIPSPSPSTAPGKFLARIADLTPGRPVVFQDPFSSDPGVLLELKDGRFVAFDAVCTHAGCTVAFEADTGYLVCPCHGAVFDPARNAKAIEGPTFQPLAAFPIVVDTVAGTISLAPE